MVPKYEPTGDPEKYSMYQPSNNATGTSLISSFAASRRVGAASLCWGVTLRLVSVYILLGNGYSLWGGFGREIDLFFLRRHLQYIVIFIQYIVIFIVAPWSQGAKLDIVEKGILLRLLDLFV